MRFVDADLRGPGAGPQGPPGPQGSPGPTSLVERLLLAAFDERLRARPGGWLTIRYLLTVPAEIELRLVKGRSQRVRVDRRAAAGRNRLRLRAPRAAGRYTLVLDARSGDDQRAAARVRLVVRRQR